MKDLIKGLHHVTSIATAAHANDRFFTRTPGLRRVGRISSPRS